MEFAYDFLNFIHQTAFATACSKHIHEAVLGDLAIEGGTRCFEHSFTVPQTGQRINFESVWFLVPAFINIVENSQTFKRL